MSRGVDTILQIAALVGLALTMFGVASIPQLYFPGHFALGSGLAGVIALALLVYFGKGMITTGQLRAGADLPNAWRSAAEQSLSVLLLAAILTGVGLTLDRALYGLLGAFLVVLTWAARGYVEGLRRGGTPYQALALVSATFRRRYLASAGRVST